MDKKQLQQLIVMMPILLIAGVYCYIKYMITPLNQQNAVLRDELKQIKSEYREAEIRAARLPRLEQEIVVLNKEISMMEKKLPANKDLPNLIRMLSKKMSSHNITWERLAPGTQSVKEHYIEHAYSIPFSSSYHNLAGFLSEVGQMERIFATRFNSLSHFPDPKTGADKVRGELTFLIYTSKT